MTTKDLESIKKSGVYFIVDYKSEDIDSAEYTGNDEELLNADNIFATEEEAQEDLESFCEDCFVCEECGEICDKWEMSSDFRICKECQAQDIKECNEDYSNKSVDYFRGRI